MMGVDQILVLMAVIPTVAAYVCRLTILKVGHNSSAVIVLHVALAMAAGWSGYHAVLDSLNFGDVMALVGAMAWIIVSLPTWVGGEVPEHFVTHPRELDNSECRKVYGGKK